MVETTVRFSRLRGLALPTGRAGFRALDSHTAYDIAWSDMLIAVLTPYGSRAGNRAFGSRLYDLLYSVGQVDVSTVSYLVKSAVEQWCPHVKIRTVMVENTSRKAATLRIVFSLTESLDTTETRSIEIPLDYVSA